MLTVEELVELAKKGWQTNPAPPPHWVDNLQKRAADKKYFVTVVQDDAAVRWLVTDAPLDTVLDEPPGRCSYEGQAYQNHGAESRCR